LTISVPLVLSMSSYSRRTFSGHYRNSVTCYGRIAALKHLPEIRNNVDSFTVYESVQDYGSLAFTTAAELGLKSDEVSRAWLRQPHPSARRMTRCKGRATGEGWPMRCG
jgi:hypothetical protein